LSVATDARRYVPRARELACSLAQRPFTFARAGPHPSCPFVFYVRALMPLSRVGRFVVVPELWPIKYAREYNGSSVWRANEGLQEEARERERERERGQGMRQAEEERKQRREGG